MLSLDKPTNELNILDGYLSKQGCLFKFDKRSEIISNGSLDNTYVINKGIVSLWRDGGGLIGIIKAPYIQGLSNSFIAREVKYRLFSESYAEGITYHLS